MFPELVGPGWIWGALMTAGLSGLFLALVLLFADRRMRGDAVDPDRAGGGVQPTQLTRGAYERTRVAPAPSAKVDVLRTIPLFSGLSRKQLGEIVPLADEFRIPAGLRLAAAGQGGMELVVIADGFAAASTERGPHAALCPGDFFGATSSLNGAGYPMTVDAATPMRILVFSPREFEALLRITPALTLDILSALSKQFLSAAKLGSADRVLPAGLGR